MTAAGVFEIEAWRSSELKASGSALAIQQFAGPSESAIQRFQLINLRMHTNPTFLEVIDRRNPAKAPPAHPAALILDRLDEVYA